MREFFKIFGATLAALFVWGIISGLLSFVFFVGILASMASQGDNSKEISVSSHSVLQLDLSKNIAERSSSGFPDFYSSLSLSNAGSLGINDISRALDAAKNDSDIDMLYVKLSDINIPDYATAQYIRELILDFKQSGKPVYAFADSYRNSSYYIATACDKIYMRKMGELLFNGLCGQSMYFKSAFDKFGIEAQVIRHGKFKSAVEPFMQDNMSEANRLQMMTYMDDIWNVILDAVSESRGISKEQLNSYADNLSLYADDELCVSSNMIDSIVFESDFNKMVQELVGQDTDSEIKLVSVSDYCKTLDNNYDGEANIAVIYASGEIVDSETSEECITSAKIVKAMEEARTNSDIKAVVFRVNSPGGSATESEIIYDELLKLKAEKPVVVSMGGYAASGGYYISCPSNYIIAEPTTITGSIGVFGLMINPSKLIKNTLAINVETVSTNKHGDFESGLSSKDSYEMEVLQRSVENIYSIFIQHVADGRNMTTAQVDSIAQGRVWTGVSAKKLGLVDELGGLDAAISKAAELADLASYKTKEYPKPVDKFEKFFSDLMESASIKYYGADVYEQMRTLEKFKNRSGVQCYYNPVVIK